MRSNFENFHLWSEQRLEEFLSRKPKQPSREQYRGVGNPEAANIDFADLWTKLLNAHQNLVRILRGVISGGVLLDVAGGGKDLMAETLANAPGGIKPREYIVFDKFAPVDGDKIVHGFPYCETRFGVRVQGDGVDLLKCVHDGSIDAVAVNGLDKPASFSSQGDMADYHERLADEIERVLRPGGLVFGVNSEVLYILRGRAAAYGGQEHWHIEYWDDRALGVPVAVIRKQTLGN